MAVTSIVRAKGGTAERTVDLSEIGVYDFRTTFLLDNGPHWEEWMKGVEEFYKELGMLLGAARAKLPLPEKFFVPDLWHHANRLRPEERETTLDMWGLGHDLAKGLGYEHSGEFKHPTWEHVVGTLYVLSSAQPS